MNRVSVARKAPRAGEQRACGVGERAGLAQRGSAFRARQAMAATGHEHHDDVITLFEIGDTRAERLDDARRLVTERHRRRTRAIAVDDRKIGMAESRGGDPDQHLTASRSIELDRLD